MRRELRIGDKVMFNVYSQYHEQLSKDVPKKTGKQPPYTIRGTEGNNYLYLEEFKQYGWNKDGFQLLIEEHFEDDLFTV